MNLRKIKLALTVGLINQPKQNALIGIREMVAGSQDVGSFLGQSLLQNKPINDNLAKKTYALQFENCTINVDLLMNLCTNSEIVQRFQVQ
ncbi:MAG: hypothetical protein MI974_01665 [Chitinophagales bacterium]|nr:hypothetical protein [Chitinophagales bacterium]